MMAKTMARIPDFSNNIYVQFMTSMLLTEFAEGSQIATIMMVPNYGLLSCMVGGSVAFLCSHCLTIAFGHKVTHKQRLYIRMIVGLMFTALGLF